jgi:hypothetical protein
MTNARKIKEYNDDRFSPLTKAPSHHPVRRTLVAVRRVYSDATYLNKRLLDSKW